MSLKVSEVCSNKTQLFHATEVVRLFNDLNLSSGTPYSGGSKRMAFKAPQQTVWLGLAGDYTTSAAECNQYVTKAGGLPSFPGAQPPPGSQSPTCGVCGHVLALVLQAYAPLGPPDISININERCLYLYGCTHPGCGTDAKAWRAFRCQLQSPTGSPPRDGSSTKLSTAADPLQQQQHKPNAYGEEDPFGAYAGFGDDLDMFGLENGNAAAATGGGKGGDVFDFSDLNSALESSTQQLKKQAGSSSSGIKAVKGAAIESEIGGAAAAPGVLSCHVELDACPACPVLPEFYISACEEPQGHQAGICQQEIDHIQALLQQYQQEEIDAGQASESSGVRRRDLGGSHDARCQDASDGESEGGPASEAETGGSWAAEEYEEDEVRGVESGYLKFQQRLLRLPQQCVRYSWNGPILWPKKQPPAPGTCPRCGEPMVYEMQVLASLISLMMEVVGLLQNDSTEGPTASRATPIPYGARITSSTALTGAANWDMCTVAVFTCSKSCGSRQEQGTREAGPGADTGLWFEENTLLVNETECHLSMH